jgi:CDGSH-type Zn-finger protein
MAETNSDSGEKKILIVRNGPYKVKGDVPLVHKTQVASEHGEPLTWARKGSIETDPGEYILCRCGQSSQMPLCDLTHRRIQWDGTETADTGPTADRQATLPGGTRIIVKKDASLCMDSGFCAMAKTTLEQLVEASADTEARSLAIAMVERCPSGALTYRMEEKGPDIEPDYPAQIADTTEITSDGPIAGPLWVTGGIPIQRSDGQPMETRERVTLCNCGLSKNKPLCDGLHRKEAESMCRYRTPSGKKE